MENISEEAIGGLAEEIGLIFDSNQKQVVAYVASSIALNGFSELILSGSLDAASIVASAFSGLEGFTLNQIKQKTETIDKNLRELMTANMKTALDYLERKNFNEAGKYAM